jgi:myo-inositol-1(or 4)-monophosphatase
MTSPTLTDKQLAERFAFATTLIREAGSLAAGYFADIGSLTVKNKGPQDLVSEADYNTEVLIKDRLHKHFPEDAFFGEETGPTDIAGAVGIWVVDPIDGTQPFLSGMANWCVSIAFIVGRTMEIGLVYDPIANELFSARRGHGATLNDRPIHVASATTFGDGIVSLGYSLRTKPDAVLRSMSRLLHDGGMYQRNGSGALSLCFVACARLIGYVEHHINSWDCLAALLIISEAGGQINDFLAGEALTEGNVVIAGPPALYPALAALVAD